MSQAGPSGDGPPAPTALRQPRGNYRNDHGKNGDCSVDLHRQLTS